MIHRGGCLCGEVVFQAEAPLGQAVVCHCSQCRRWSGHLWAGSLVPHERFRLLREAGLAWYRSSDIARRGFCRDCGASLLWQHDGEAQIYLAAGALEAPTGLAVGDQWHREDAGDYYSPEGPPPPPGPAPARLEGACLCGACRFTLPGPAGDIFACHCSQCRRLSGHYSASFDAVAEPEWQAREGLVEFASPGGGRRGFCRLCGSSLWFRGVGGGLSVEAGSIRGPTGGRLARHIFAAFKGDYYALDDGLPVFPGGG